MDLDIQPQGTRLTDWIGSPYPFVSVSGDAALAVMSDICRAFQDASPVIWGSREEAARLFELFDDEPETTPQSIVARASGRRAQAIMDEHSARLREQLAEWYGRRGKALPPDKQIEPPRGAWPSSVRTAQAPGSLFDLAHGRPKQEILIGLIPTARAWEIPAYHKFGNWNDCPAPQVHVAIAREWQERFGARLIVNTGDVIEFEIEAPIASREEAIEVALQQYTYCPDIVLQGSETVDQLAASLVGARYWFFWWD